MNIPLQVDCNIIKLIKGNQKVGNLEFINYIVEEYEAKRTNIDLGFIKKSLKIDVNSTTLSINKKPEIFAAASISDLMTFMLKRKPLALSLRTHKNIFPEK